MTKYYIADRGNNLHQAYCSLKEALEAHLGTGKGAGDNLKVSLGVSYIDDDFSRPVFTICEPGRFHDTTSDRLASWEDWFELDWVSTLYKLN